MKRAVLAFVGFCVLSAPSLASDFFSFHDQLFRNQTLCDRDRDQLKAERDFKRMYLRLKRDDSQRRASPIEVADYLAYSTTLRQRASRAECSILQHEDCYSAFCNF